MAQRCGTCGSFYDGWECPICKLRKQSEEAAKQLEDLQRDSRALAEDQEAALSSTLRAIENAKEDIEDSIYEAQVESQLAQEEAVRRVRQTVSQDWKLRAGERTKSAYELFDVGMFSEADNLVSRALVEDPSNLYAHCLKARLLAKASFLQEAHNFLWKAVSLLNTSAYINDTDAYLCVLDLVALDQRFHSLTGDFCKALGKHSPSRGHLQILGKLLSLNLDEEALAYFVRVHATAWKSKETLRSIGIFGVSDYFRNVAYLFGIESRLGHHVDHPLLADATKELLRKEVFQLDKARGSSESLHAELHAILGWARSNPVLSSKAIEDLVRSMNEYVSAWNESHLIVVQRDAKYRALAEWDSLFFWPPIVGFVVGILVGCTTFGFSGSAFNSGVFGALLGIAFGCFKYSRMKKVEVKVCPPVS